ncbi:MAG: hypothetical protein IJS71_01820 [Clostridia bacterium]|nr:hypothetical protein [Clostridia bacterium]
MAFETYSNKRNKLMIGILLGVVAVVLILFIIIELIILKKGGIDTRTKTDATPTPYATVDQEATPAPTSEPTAEPTEEPWIAVNPEYNTIETRFNPPKGYTRVSVEPGSFAEFLRTYQLKPYGTKPEMFTGYINDDSSDLGVFNQQMTLVQYQQCADTAMMLYAEYLFKEGLYSEISFNFANGFKCDFEHWAEGNRVSVSGNTVKWVLSTDKAGVKAGDYSFQNLVNYLHVVYQYANTASLAQELPKANGDLQIGDIIIGTTDQLRAQAMLIGSETASEVSYGHAIIIADMAVNEAGEKVYLFIEGTTPATECCVVENPDGVSACWYKFNADGTFVKGVSGIVWKTEWGRKFKVTERPQAN